MKKLFLLLVFAFLVLAFFILKNTFMYQYMKAPEPNDVSPTLSVKPTSLSKSVTLENEQFSYAYFTVTDTAKISLIPNFTEKLDTRTIIEQNTCRAATNGGFYDTNYQPLGLFVASGKKLKNEISSRLFNGFVHITRNNEARITNESLEDTRITVQTGPLLLSDGTPLPLIIQNDEGRRRMIAGVNEKGNLIFLTVFREDATFEGPLLATLPAVMAKINSQENLRITDAVNLDGGSASVFYTKDFTLRELTTVGSLFCLSAQ